MKENSASIKVLEKAGMQFVDIIDFEKHEGVLYQLKKQ
jgi:RimJ/RimL family protein N-acetyltransferase